MGSPKPLVLIVDDEPLNRDLLFRVLETEYEVLTAEDAEQALELLDSEEGAGIGIVLCDHWMPGMTGVELADVIKSKTRAIPVVLVTGFDQEQEVEDAKERGALAAVLPKPWRTKVLRELIAELLA